MAQTGLLRDRPAIQADVARAAAIVRSTRAFMHETIAEVWDALESGRKVTEEQRAYVRIAAVDGVFLSEICASAFCVAIADTPHIPAMIARTVSTYTTNMPRLTAGIS